MVCIRTLPVWRMSGGLAVLLLRFFELRRLLLSGLYLFEICWLLLFGVHLSLENPALLPVLLMRGVLSQRHLDTLP